LSVEIEELQKLIEHERAAEDKVRRAKEEAQEIVKKAREQAESIVQAAESDPYEQQFRQTKKDEMERKKAEIAEDYKRRISNLNKMAEKNLDKAVSFVTKEVLRVEV
jgi:V/A-type H+-transporting ATPase subunit G/H